MPSSGAARGGGVIVEFRIDGPLNRTRGVRHRGVEGYD